ncbi:MAG: anti-virulence regulator CigR family protein [Gemmatimonadota bacterium]
MEVHLTRPLSSETAAVRTPRPSCGLPLVLTLALLAVGEPALAQGPPGTRGGGQAAASVEVVFTSVERDRIRSFYAQRSGASVEALPPGIQKKLARGKPLPPGLARRVLPAALEDGLPLRSGYQRVEVGLDVLLVEVATGIIHDVLRDVIVGGS